ncbi:MAG TPA: hypothetical protein VGP45_06005, partial [Marinobacter sp.]|nr:hypothetical protein [Marinobacter sp.]
MQATDIDTAVDSLLAPAEIESQETAAEALEEETEEAEVDTEAEEVSDEAEFDDEAEDEADADEADADDEDNEDEETDADEKPETFKVKVDGDEVEVTLDELKRDYSGQKYIQKGMQQAAEARKQAEALFNTLQNERQQFIATVQQVQQQGLMTPPQKPSEDLLNKDPIGYMQENARYEKQLASYQQQMAQLQDQALRQRQLEEQASQVMLQEQAQRLIEMIPEFADAEKANEIKSALVKVGTEAYGFAADELSGIKDARMVKVLHDAYKWQQLQSGKAQAKKQPAPSKNVKPKARRPEPQKVVRRKKL